MERYNMTIINESGDGVITHNHVHQKECSYKEFWNCKPKDFDGTKGVLTMMQWFEKTESIFEICECLERSIVKLAAFTFTERALTWWVSHVKSLGLTVENSMGWENMKELMREEYCPRGEIQKLEEELWNLSMDGFEIVTYTNRFSELVALCLEMVTPESKKIERYIWGLSPLMIGDVLSSNPITFDSAKCLAHRLVDHEAGQNMITPISESLKGNACKRKSGNDEKRESTQKAKIYVATTPVIPKTAKNYAGTLLKCDRCTFHHTRACREMHCKNCNRKGHTVRFCRAPAQPISQVPSTGFSHAFYGCGKTGHMKRDFLITRNSGADGRILMITSTGETTPDPR
ncbi:uncharacterized protein LOC111882908 [Lactuca sativa]|uniref:uncharacterized protein LOC111882908 n=1 Tax=Lactuca sativa TaxID=4236 RepID=UPI000CD80EEF|nr:uncharacterized protein LOC111882908 [Lactuca sativa]